MVSVGELFLRVGTKSDGSILKAKVEFQAVGRAAELTTQKFLKLEATDSKVRQGLKATSQALNANEASWKKLQVDLGLVSRAEVVFNQRQKELNRLLKAGTINAKAHAAALGLARNRLRAGGVAAGGFKLKMQELNKSVQIALGPLSGVAARLTAFSGLVGQANLKIAAFTGGLIGFTFALAKSIGQATDFEEAMTGVAKTTNLTNSELVGLGRSFLGLSRELGESSINLAKIAETAGALGVRGTENLSNFTAVIAKLGKATDLVGQTAAKQLVRLINVTTTSITEIEVLGAVITGLGNQSAATEKEINKIAVEIGGATSAFRISAFEAEAFGAALASIGARAELSGSVMGRAFRAIDKSIRGGGQSMKFLSDLTGILQKDLKKTFADAPATVFKLFLQGLNQLDTSTGSVASALEIFGLKGEEINKIIPALAGNISILEEAWSEMNRQIIEANALNEETERRLDTVAAKQDILRESIRNIAIEIGDNFLPASKGLLDVLNSFLANSGPISKAFNAIGIALGSLLVAKLATLALLPLVGAFAKTGTAARGAAGAITFLGRSIKLAIGPVGWFILAAEAAFFFSDSLLKVLGITKQIIPEVDRLNDTMAEFLRLQRRDPAAAEEFFENELFKLEQREEALQKVLISQTAGKATTTGHQKSLSRLFQTKRNEAELKTVNDAIAITQGKIDATQQQMLDLRVLIEDAIDAAGEVKLFGRKRVPAAEETTKQRKIREKNAAVLESIKAIEAETLAIQSGREALKLFNEEKEIEKQVRTILKGIIKTESESAIEFTMRRANIEQVLHDVIRQRISAEKEARSEEALKRAEDSIELLEEEIEAVQGGTEAYKTFKEEIKIEKDVANFEKRQRDAGLEEDAVLRLTMAYEKLRRKLPEVQKELKKIEAENKKLDKLAADLAGSFESAFEDAIAGGKSFQEVMRALEVDIIKVITRFLVIQPLIESLKNSLKSTGAIGGGGGGGLFSGLIKGIGGFFGSLFGGSATIGGGGGGASSFLGAGASFGGIGPSTGGFVFDTGGVVGRGGKRTPLATFDLGGSVQGLGLSPGQVPIIADEGETIRTPEQERRLTRRKGGDGPTIINFNFPPGIDVRGFRKSLPQLGADAARAIDRGKRNM